MNTLKHLAVIGLMAAACQACALTEFIINGTLDDYLTREYVFGCICENISYEAVFKTSDFYNLITYYDIFCGFKHDDPYDTLAIGCSDFHDKGLRFQEHSIRPEEIILRVPNKDLGVLNTSIELNPQNQKVRLEYSIKKYDSNNEVFYLHEEIIATVESGHIQFSSFSPEFMSPSNVTPVEGTFEVAGHFSTREGEVLPFEITDGYFHVFLEERRYK